MQRILDALSQVARTEGLLLDRMYSGKAFAEVLADIESGHSVSGPRLLSVMTGGVPGPYAYRSLIFQAPC